MSILRRDAVTGRWTIMSPGKPLDRRPASKRRATADSGRRGFCPFCPGQEDKTPPAVLVRSASSRDPGAWSVRVVPNKFPILDSSLNPAPSASGLYDRMTGFGLHEVVIESPEHDVDLSMYTPEQSARVIGAWAERYAKIAEDPRVRYVLLFRNRGAGAGASLEHPHSQVIALPIVPKVVAEEIEGARRYFEWKDRCVFCDIIRDEQLQGVRVVRETPHFIAFMPYAARFSYETWILPKDHDAHFRSISGREPELGGLLCDVLTRLDLALDRPPYNLLIHSAPCHDGDLSHYHWHIEIMPRLARIAGFEWGTGFYINPVLPETAARELQRIKELES